MQQVGTAVTRQTSAESLLVSQWSQLFFQQSKLHKNAPISLNNSVMTLKVVNVTPQPGAAGRPESSRHFLDGCRNLFQFSYTSIHEVQVESWLAAGGPAQAKRVGPGCGYGSTRSRPKWGNNN